jgi:hypothetical protein
MEHREDRRSFNLTIDALFRISLLAGLTASIVEMIVVLPIQAMLGASPEVVFQSIARGLLGRAAFTEGLGSMALGIFIHVLISVVAALCFVAAAARTPALVERPVISGVIFGVLVYLVMTFIVVPLSAIGFHLPKSYGLMAISFAVHLFAFGLPIGLVTAAMLGRSSDVP